MTASPELFQNSNKRRHKKIKHSLFVVKKFNKWQVNKQDCVMQMYFVIHMHHNFITDTCMLFIKM